MSEEEKTKIRNFIQDFGCCSLRQLQILFNKPNNNFKDVLQRNFATKKGDIIVHNNAKIDIKMIAALDVLCRYKKRLKRYHKNFYPTYITFLTTQNVLYNIVVTDKKDEKGILKLLRNSSPLIPEADKFILLFTDDSKYYEVECDTPYIYCVYPELRILQGKDYTQI